MANLVLVLGKTSTGKSRSMKNLDPSKTYIINCKDKDLPFKTGRINYNREKKNIMFVNQWEKIVKLLMNIPEAKPEVTTIILDDARYIMENEYIDRANEVGYSKFTQLGQHMAAVIETAATIGTKALNVYMMLHTDDVINGTNIITYKAKLVGKLVEDHFDPMEQATVCLFTYAQTSQAGTKYFFVTNKTNVDGVVIPAKSPEEMFPDIMIENDLALVNKYIHDYYKEVE